MYTKLQLKSYIKKIVLNKISILNNNYISVHIRRTDHIWLAKKENQYTSDNEFMNFLNKYDKNIYVATDNKETYDKFKKLYPDQIKFNYHKSFKNTLRETSLLDAIVDIYMCIYSYNFMGSGWSSFSGLIKELRTHQLKLKN